MDIVCIIILCCSLIGGSCGYFASFPVKMMDKIAEEEYGTNYTVVNLSCEIMLHDGKTADDLQSLVADKAKLIYITLDFDNDNMSQSREFIFQPLSWVYTTGKQGRGLLMTPRNSGFLSLGTMSIGTEHISVKVSMNPPGCLSEISNLAFESSIRKFLSEDMIPTADKIDMENNHVCNEHIHSLGGYAVYEYMCCYKHQDGDFACYHLQHDTWKTILFLFILITKLACLMFAANLIPHTFYRQRYGYDEYSFNPKSKLKFRVQHNQDKPSNVLVKCVANVSNLGLFEEDMPESSLSLSDKISENKDFSGTISRIWFKVNTSRLIPDNYVPVGIFLFIYHRLFRCMCYKIQGQKVVDTNKAQSDISDEPFSVRRCCKTEVCDIFNIALRWNSIFRAIMNVVLLAIVLSPVVIRVFIYLDVESADEMSRKMAAHERDLNYVPSYQSFSFISWLSPIHPLYITIYVVFFITGLSHLILKMYPNYHKKLKVIIRFSIREMHNKQDILSWGWAAAYSIVLFNFKQLKNHQILAAILWVLWLPLASVIICLVLLLFNLPTLNVVLRIIWNLFKEIFANDKGDCFTNLYWILNLPASKMEGPTRKQIEKDLKAAPSTLLWKLGCFWWILFLLCTLPILADIVFTLVDLAIYTVIGVILNAAFTMKFVSIIFMLALYGNDCFGSVTNKYIAFNKKIRSVILGKTSDKVKEVAQQDAKSQVNTAIQVVPEVSDENVNQDIQNRFKAKNGQVSWSSKYIVEFLNKDDTLYLTKRFFFGSCYMPYHGCPGKLKYNLYDACSQFMVIILFLLFVLFVVNAFGDAFKVSGTNQMLATLAGGFLPFIFRRVLFTSVAGLSLDENDYKFQICLNNLLEEYSQSWPLSDLEVESGDNDKSNNETDTWSDDNERDSNMNFVANCGTVWLKSDKENRYIKLEISEPDAVNDDTTAITKPEDVVVDIVEPNEAGANESDILLQPMA